MTADGTATTGAAPFAVAPDVRALARGMSAVECLATLVTKGMPLERLVPRPLGVGTASGDEVRWQHPAVGELLHEGPLTLGLPGASIADLLPGYLTGPATGSTVAVGLDLAPFPTDAHLLAAPLDAAMLRAEVAAVLEARRLEMPYGSPAVVDRLLAAFGFQDPVPAPAGAAAAASLSADERALLLRLMPFLADLMGTNAGAELALRAVLGAPVTVRCRQPRTTPVPRELQSRLGSAMLGVDFLPGCELQEANGYLVTIGPVSAARCLALRSPQERRKQALLLEWLLPQGGAIEVRLVVDEADRRLQLGAGQRHAVLGVTTWTCPRDTARSQLRESP